MSCVTPRGVCLDQNKSMLIRIMLDLHAASVTLCGRGLRLAYPPCAGLGACCGLPTFYRSLLR